MHAVYTAFLSVREKEVQPSTNDGCLVRDFQKMLKVKEIFAILYWKIEQGILEMSSFYVICIEYAPLLHQSVLIG